MKSENHADALLSLLDLIEAVRSQGPTQRVEAIGRLSGEGWGSPEGLGRLLSSVEVPLDERVRAARASLEREGTPRPLALPSPDRETGGRPTHPSALSGREGERSLPLSHSPTREGQGGEDRLALRQFEASVGREWRVRHACGKRLVLTSLPFFPEEGRERFAVVPYGGEGIEPGEMRATIQRFLGQDGAFYLLWVLERALKRRVDLDDVAEVALYPKAEGKFTGVFRLAARLRGDRRTCDVAIHVAKNEPSTPILFSAYRATALCHARNPRYLPEPYLFATAEARFRIADFGLRISESATRNPGRGDDPVDRPGLGSAILQIGIVTEEWLTGHDELHVTYAENGDRFIVWHAADDHEPLSAEESASVSEEIARLLTIYTDFEVRRTILTAATWVNGGDFVFRRAADGAISVKLTTVRGFDEGVDPSEFLSRLVTLTAVDADFPRLPIPPSPRRGEEERGRGGDFSPCLPVSLSPRQGEGRGEVLRVSVMPPLRAFQGFRRGLIEAYGAPEGERRARRWLSDFGASERGAAYRGEIGRFLE